MRVIKDETTCIAPRNPPRLSSKSSAAMLYYLMPYLQTDAHEFLIHDLIERGNLDLARIVLLAKRYR